MSIVDESPYPFAEPMAQQLLLFLAGAYSREEDALRFVEKFGIDTLEVARGRSPLNLWHELLERAAVAGATRAIVQGSRQQHPKNPRASFLDALLADKPVPVSADVGEDGESRFVTGDDTVTEREALLFFDDLTMQVGKVPSFIETLGKVMANVPAVCLLRVANSAGEFFGTGFRIGKDLVLTNEHVLFPKDRKASTVHADFDFDVDTAGASLNIVSLAGDTATIVGDRADDWATVRVAGMDANWPILDLAAAPPPKENDLAYILQHPGGQRKRLGFVRNTISAVSDRTVHYLTDTQPGSSGAPVFDTEGRVIALHHAGGQPSAVAGKPPVSKNEGIRISRVFEGLKAKGALL